MNCSRCRCPIPDTALTCPACLIAASDRALEQYQHGPLSLVAAGKGKLIVRAIQNERHLEMFGFERTFCGLEVSSGHRKSWVEFPLLGNVCAKCRERVERLVQQAARVA